MFRPCPYYNASKTVQILVGWDHDETVEIHPHVSFCQAYVKWYTVGRIKAGQRERVPLSWHVSTQRAHNRWERASLSTTVHCQRHTTWTLSVAAGDCKNYLRTAFVGDDGGHVPYVCIYPTLYDIEMNHSDRVTVITKTFLNHILVGS